MGVKLKIKPTELNLKVKAGDYKFAKYTGSYTITPTQSTQTIPIADKLATSNITVNPIPSQYVNTSDATLDSGGKMLASYTAYAGSTKYTGTIPTKSANNMTVSGSVVSITSGYYPSNVSKAVGSAVLLSSASLSASVSLSIDSGGNVTASFSEAVQLNPVSASGWAKSDASLGIEMQGSNSMQLAVQPASTITPTESSQVAVDSGRWTIGSVVVGAIPSAYIIPSGTSTFTSNSTYDVRSLESAIVSVPSGIDGNNLSYGLTDRTLPRIGVGQVGYMTL